MYKNIQKLITFKELKKYCNLKVNIIVLSDNDLAVPTTTIYCKKLTNNYYPQERKRKFQCIIHNCCRWKNLNEV